MSSPGKQIRHGNYHQYYEIRRPQDSRPQHFEETLPKCLAELSRLDAQQNNTNKDVHLLDIGCNSGKLTNSILAMIQQSASAKGKSARGIGVDIDEELIEEAAKTYTTGSIEFAQADISAIALGQATENPIGDYLNRNSIQQFDFVICFSILMFVHLNHGDDGLIKVLDYICSMTKILILELQDEKKYREHVEKMQTEGGGDYPSYKSLKWIGSDGKLEQMISDYVVDRGFKILCDQQQRNERNRKIVILSRNN